MMERSDEIFTELSWFRRERVTTARVMVIGCGALGNEVIKSLAMFGVGIIVVVDFDNVEVGNLSRSVLFSRSDAEASILKVEAIKHGVERVNPDVKVISIAGDIATEVGLSLIGSMDVIVGCVDSRWARYCINRLAFRAGIAWVDGGIDGLEGTARLFEYGHNCYSCSLGENGLREMARRISCSSIVRHNRESGRVATTPIIASIIGAIEAQEAMKIVHRDVVEPNRFTTLRGKMFYYEGEHMTTKILGFEAYDEGCPHHERWDDIEQSDLSAEQPLCKVLSSLKEMLGGKEVVIELLNHSFVEYIESRDGLVREVMLPSYRVESFVEGDKELRGRLSSQLYQREWQELGCDFPYQDLTLLELGVPRWDVLQVTSDDKVHHISLDGDRGYYNI